MKKILILGLIYIFFSPICLGNQSENLQKLKDLYDDNILTEDQYNEAREKVLQQMEIYNEDKTVSLEAELSGGECDPEPGGKPCESEIEPYRYEYTTDSFLSTYGLKPEDLSPMLLELGKKTQATVPECTTDFCFTTQAEYATDEIINKGALINALYRQHPDYKIEPNWWYQQSSYCSEKKGCYMFQKDYTWEIKKENNTKVITARWYPTELFPEKEIDPDCKTVDPEGSCFNREVPRQITQGTESMGLFTPDVWLEENGLTVEDVINMLKDYPTTYKIDRNTAIEGKGGMVSIPLKAKYSYTDEIVNTDQLLQSLLFWNPRFLGEGIEVSWVDKDNIKVFKMAYETVFSPVEDPPVDPPIRPGWKILEGTDMLVINDDDPYWQTEEGLIERPPKIDPGIEYAPESVSDDPPIESAPGEGKQEPDHCGSPPCPEENLEPPPKLADPTVLQPIDPGIEGDPSSELTSNMNDSKVEIKEMTKEEKKQHRIDTETLRRANEGDFSDHIKRELAGAAARLGVIPPKEEDFSQNIQTGQSGDGTMSKKTSSPTDPNPPPKIPEEGNFAPESVSDDPPIESAPGEGKQEPNHCGSPPCP